MVDNSIGHLQTHFGPVFVIWTVRTGHLFPRRSSNRVLLRAPSFLSLPHYSAPHLACEPLKRKPLARGNRVLPLPSIVDGPSQLPSPVFAAGSVALAACLLVLAAARASLAARHGDGQK